MSSQRGGPQNLRQKPIVESGEFATRHVGPRRRERRANNTTPSGLTPKDAVTLEAAEDKRRGGPANLGEPPGSGTPAPTKLPGEKNWWV